MVINASGPYYTEDKPEAAAYIVRDNFIGSLCTLCFVILDDETQRNRIEQNYQALFYTVMNYAYEKYEKWNSIPLFICFLQPTKDNDAELNIFASQIKEDSPDKIAQRVLVDTVIQKQETFNGESYAVTYFGKIPETDLHEVTISKGAWNYNIPVIARDSADLSLIPEMMEHMDQLSIDMYFDEVIRFIEEENPEEVFHSFSHYALLAEENGNVNLSEALDLALSAAKFLILHGFHDYADWTATWASSLALKHQKYEQALDALRYSGIANEGLGRINELKTSYEKALNILCNIENPKKAAELYMSYGISLIVLAFSFDFDDSCETGSNSSLQADILCPAQNYLEKAYYIFKKHKPINKFSICSIELDLIRIDDLRGNHEKALLQLQELINKNKYINEDPRLSITTLVYAVAAIRHLYLKDNKYQQQYHLYLQKAAEIVPYISSKIRDKACYLCIWIGDALLGLENAEAAAAYYSAAYDIQQDFKQNEIRAAGPGTIYGGVTSIDIAGRLQNSLLAQYNSIEFSALILQAFTACEKEKARFFRRDLIFRNSSKESQLSMYLKQKYNTLRSAISNASKDQRILLSDYKWFLKWDVNAKDQSELEAFDHYFNNPLSLDRIQKLFSHGQHSTAIVSFYVTEHETLIYITREPFNNITSLKLAVDSAKLEKVSQAFHTGIYGNEFIRKLNYASPEKNSKLFQPLFALSSDLVPLVSELKDVDMIYICPHGLWHSIPIHMLLLPALWKEGSIPAIVYTPSIHLLELLHERHTNRHLLQYKKYGLTTAHADSDAEAPFLTAHNTIYDIFQNSGVNTLDAFGRQATVENTMETMNKVGLYHITAHGCFIEGEKAMNSGILLSGASGLPLKNTAPNATGTMIMLNGTSASHITLQACSLGKRLSAQGNEFWGFCRATISAGADTVIAPLWDTDLYSSTNFFELFYNNWLVDRQPKWKAWANAQFSMFMEPVEASWSHFIHWAAFQLIGYCEED